MPNFDCPISLPVSVPLKTTCKVGKGSLVLITWNDIVDFSLSLLSISTHLFLILPVLLSIWSRVALSGIFFVGYSVILTNPCLSTVAYILSSGLNYKKSGLKKLLKLIMTKSIDILILNHKDRLLRFGSELIFSLCNFYKIEVIIIEDKELNFNEELTHNVIELMTVFCAKLYGKRSHKNKLLKPA